MKKYLVIMLGVTAIMMTACGCGNQEETVEAETISEMDQIVNECQETSDELCADVYDLYNETFKEIYGDDFDMDELMIVDDSTVSYEGQTVSIEYVEELAYNNMMNEW